MGLIFDLAGEPRPRLRRGKLGSSRRTAWHSGKRREERGKIRHVLLRLVLMRGGFVGLHDVFSQTQIHQSLKHSHLGSDTFSTINTVSKHHIDVTKVTT